MSGSLRATHLLSVLLCLTLNLMATRPLQAQGSGWKIETILGSGRAGFAGDGGPATSALINQPFHCELDGKDTLYIAEAFNHCIRKVDLKTRLVSTVAGSGKKGYSGDGGPATNAT